MRGNVIDLAVGVVIGGAFGKIVSSIVNDLVMPPIGLIINNVNFKDLKWVLAIKPDGTPLLSVNYGNFIQNVFEFVIIGAVIFLMVKAINKLQTPKVDSSAAAKVISDEIKLLTEIRDLLKK
jgi:large conductance mechanosensitive channel